MDNYHGITSIGMGMRHWQGERQSSIPLPGENSLLYSYFSLILLQVDGYSHIFIGIQFLKSSKQKKKDESKR